VVESRKNKNEIDVTIGNAGFRIKPVALCFPVRTGCLSVRTRKTGRVESKTIATGLVSDGEEWPIENLA